MNLTVRIKFHADRSKLGELCLVDADGQVLIGPKPCLGLADQAKATKENNPKRRPVLPYGDTPTGLYGIAVLPPGADQHSYGPGKRLLMVPRQGPCIEAEKNGRTGLMIHGGPLNPDYVWWGGLRPANGCPRVHDEDLAEVIAKIESTGGDATASITEAD